MFALLFYLHSSSPFRWVDRSSRRASQVGDLVLPVSLLLIRQVCVPCKCLFFPLVIKGADILTEYSILGKMDAEISGWSYKKARSPSPPVALPVSPTTPPTLHWDDPTVPSPCGKQRPCVSLGLYTRRTSIRVRSIPAPSPLHSLPFLVLFITHTCSLRY